MGDNMETEKTSLRYIVTSLVSITAFLLLLGGASFAYYTQSVGSATGDANIANAQVTVPRGCTFVSSATNCVLEKSSAGTTDFTDSNISIAEMSPAYKGNSVAETTCALNVGVQGNQGCKCTYTVSLVGQTTTDYVAGSLKAAITSTNTSHSKTETDVESLSTIVTAKSDYSANTLTVASTGTAVYENFAVTLKAYNVDDDQDAMAGGTYVYYLRATPTCSVG